MKRLSLSLLLIFLLSASINILFFHKAEAEQDQSSTIDLSEPPFWMFSYDEFKDLQNDQKSFYLGQVESELKKIPTLNSLTKDGIKEASEWSEGWDIMQRKLYRACTEKSHQKTCERLADLRVQALDMHSNKKMENRQASK